MTRRLLIAALALALGTSLTQAADRPSLEDHQFEEKLRGLKTATRPGEKLSAAQAVSAGSWLSSRQVRTIAAMLGDDDARLEFATAAYPRTVDPENFYEVYDAFTTFSRVMRLHDRVREMRRPAPVPAPPIPGVTEAEMKDILRALRQEPFDDAKAALARRIIGARRDFLTAQIKQILAQFTFENARLELAKFAYDHTLDREKYYLVNESFTFKSSRDELNRYIESKHNPPPKPLPR